jgi:hypothetical protein
MGLRYQKRVNLGKGMGLQVSKSGLSASYRNRLGSIGSSGFSIRTGIPGLSIRQSWGKKSGPVVFLLAVMIYSIILIGWNIARLIAYLIIQAYQWITTHTHYESLRSEK